MKHASQSFGILQTELEEKGEREKKKKEIFFLEGPALPQHCQVMAAIKLGSNIFAGISYTK